MATHVYLVAKYQLHSGEILDFIFNTSILRIISTVVISSKSLKKPALVVVLDDRKGENRRDQSIEY